MLTHTIKRAVTLSVVVAVAIIYGIIIAGSGPQMYRGLIVFVRSLTHSERETFVSGLVILIFVGVVAWAWLPFWWSYKAIHRRGIMRKKVVSIDQFRQQRELKRSILAHWHGGDDKPAA
ncbi:MAG: hypothetical protein A2566_00210 [Candidatus Zambryskibacteria bacterium RIFOXYD1_FULL_40_13]|nr:MAG: hypothetical protein UT25_C0004G0028 [Parcubacteria group bacterium GW2011_GWC1_39_12]KKR19108.1 MAG: hypothetical protein UT49_C0003G0028 [Parcubacteria group bacterium GW2011_GWF1_39_37]KKR34976.1 MAG: hypothetical protein UT68_C0006G0023 [Parcubacteria group bacterium GW2011_GWC2_40_10]KKR51871.1 MAG: hypothetical protein UT89_C0005G0028 [Parcubacteria group bacterium GW2011_GWE1_40_20]KKR66170.1 MAG: hypothetical protein UU06_C0004G0002 [Parcubacteria group bacterium GW2011_GWB1_40_